MPFVLCFACVVGKWTIFYYTAHLVTRALTSKLVYSVRLKSSCLPLRRFHIRTVIIIVGWDGNKQLQSFTLSLQTLVSNQFITPTYTQKLIIYRTRWKLGKSDGNYQYYYY